MTAKLQYFVSCDGMSVVCDTEDQRDHATRIMLFGSVLTVEDEDTWKICRHIMGKHGRIQRPVDGLPDIIWTQGVILPFDEWLAEQMKPAEPWLTDFLNDHARTDKGSDDA